MRPDTRSFSFTWMKGGQGEGSSSTEQPHQRLDNDSDPSSSGEGPSSSQQLTMDPLANSNNEGGAAGRSFSGSRLRKLSNSLVRLRGNKAYANMDNLSDENNWHRISEEPINLEDGEDDEDDGKEVKMDIGPDVIAEARSRPIRVSMPFQSLDNLAMDTTAARSSRMDENGANMSLTKRLNKTVQNVKASFGNFSQRFRKSTRRRISKSSTPGSAKSPTRKILGRTPTKLYSPFGFDSPVVLKTPKRLLDRPSTPRMARKSMVASMVYSPSNNFRRDLDDARRGMSEFHILSRDITRRSVRF